MTETDMSRFFAGRMGRISASSIREICKLAGMKGLVSLAGGWPNPDTFPYAFTKKTVSRLMRDRSPEVLQYGMSEGLIPLREWFAGWLKQAVMKSRV